MTASIISPTRERRITREQIEAAARSIDPIFLHTPQWVCERIGETLGAHVALKAETLNPIRSFNGLGAAWLVQNLPPGVALICASAATFGQAMAASGSMTVVPPSRCNVPPMLPETSSSPLRLYTSPETVP